MCSYCKKKGFHIGEAQLRAISAETAQLLANASSHGVYTITKGGPASYSPYRLINQTRKCSGPALVLFEHGPPDDTAVDW